MSKTVSATEAATLGIYRVRVASRAAAAIGGGYMLAATCAAAGALGFQHLGLARSDATMAATMLSFMVHAIAAMWCFGCASATRAWIGCAVPALLLAALTWLLLPGGQP
ncbi:DUF3649 domain-containing protein [Comamonas sp. GB3 AK4-5]|uniref:DUF3649 domain-containing protein n=1 Tax=Comamonas sp. GB3 AK4-5 TaxID=3231487 RepID=UPI00351F01B7